MPISSVTLARTQRPISVHLKNYELGTITETNPSNGVYRYTFANGTSPYSWDEIVKSIGTNLSGPGYGYRVGINVGYYQAGTLNGSGNWTSINPNILHGYFNNPTVDSIRNRTINGVATLPSGRFNETTGTYASFLGDATYATSGFFWLWQPDNSRMTTNSPVTVNYENRYIEINWNQIALNETTYTTTQRSYGRAHAGNVKLVFQPFMVFDAMDSADYGVYLGKPRYYNTTIAGNNLATLASSPPAAITNFTYPGGRVFEWTETTSNYASAYIYLYKWNGSSWGYVREGFISDGQTAINNDSNNKSGAWNRYTVPTGDGSGYFYIGIYQYDGYNNAFSGASNSTFISV